MRALRGPVSWAGSETRLAPRLLRSALAACWLLAFPSLVQGQEAARPQAAPIEHTRAAGGRGPAGVESRPFPTSAADSARPGVNRGSILQLFTPGQPDALAAGALLDRHASGYALERLLGAAAEAGRPARLRRPVPRTARRRQARPRPGAGALQGQRQPGGAGLRAMSSGYWGQPAATIRQAVGYDAAGEVIDLKRNVRVLNGTATLAPLLGLLGTVVGMIQSFDALGGRVGAGQGRGAGPGDQPGPGRHGVRAWRSPIVSVAAYYFLLNRVDVLVRDLDDHARQVIDLVSAEAIRPAPTAGPAPRPGRLEPPARSRSSREDQRRLRRPRNARCLPTPSAGRPGDADALRPPPGRRVAAHQHDADGGRRALPAGLLHGGDPALRLGRERVRRQRPRGRRRRPADRGPGRPGPDRSSAPGTVAVGDTDLRPRRPRPPASRGPRRGTPTRGS